MKQERHQGHKPPVAFASEAAAKANIEAKRQFLLKIVARLEYLDSAEAIDVKNRQQLLGVLPKSVAAFNRWAAEALDDSLLGDWTPFRRNAPATLRNSGLLPSVQAALAAARAFRHRPNPAGMRGETLGALRRRLKLSEQLRKIAEESVHKTKSDYNALQMQYDAIKLQLQAANREAMRLVAAQQTKPVRAKGNVSPLRPKGPLTE